MEIFIVVIAFVFGFGVKQVGLPPLVGFLIAGFVLNYLNVEAGSGFSEHVYKIYSEKTAVTTV